MQARVATVRAGSLSSKVRFLGNIQSALSTPIAAAVSGRVRRVLVRPGQRVAKNALMLDVDSRRVRADLKAAEAKIQRTRAQLAQARRQEARLKTSSAALSAPERERYHLDVAVLEAQLAIEKAAAQHVRVDLADHRISAPFAGVVRDRLVNPGAWVNVGDSVVELVSAEEIEALVDVPGETGLGIKRGDAAQIFSAGQRVAAVVAGIVPALDPQTRMMRLRLVLPKGTATPTWLLPGLAVDVELEHVVRGDGVLVPRDAVVRGPVANRVIKVVDGVGTIVPITLLGSTESAALVRGEGLAAGDLVMTRGNQRYRPGTPVSVEQQ